MKIFNKANINWEKVANLVPVIIQDNQSGQVLMLGYMNAEALNLTCETGEVTFYSRTKKRLWVKGEASGYKLKVKQILADCDDDTLLILAEIEGPCCHLNQKSCFGDSNPNFTVLSSLENLILSRYKERPQNHYTTELFEQGIKRIAQKVGEEGVEVALAASCGDNQELSAESADLLFHLLVLLVAKGSSFSQVLMLLKERSLRHANKPRDVENF